MLDEAKEHFVDYEEARFVDYYHSHSIHNCRLLCRKVKVLLDDQLQCLASSASEREPVGVE